MLVGVNGIITENIKVKVKYESFRWRRKYGRKRGERKNKFVKDVLKILL